MLVLLRPHQQRKHQIFSAERQYLNGATCLHHGKFCWTTQRLQQHLAYIPKRPGYNPCFHALYSQGWEVDYELVHFPKQVVGLARRECLQTLGPPFELGKQNLMGVDVNLTLRQPRNSPWSEGHRLEMRCLRWRSSGSNVIFSHGGLQTLRDKSWWIAGYRYSALSMVRTKWLGTTGSPSSFWHGAIIGSQTLLLSFLDGEAKQIVDDLFAQFATELPRSKLLHRFLPLSLVCYCVETDPAPHRSMPVACAPRKHPKRDSRVSHVAPIESILHTGSVVDGAPHMPF